MLLLVILWIFLLQKDGRSSGGSILSKSLSGRSFRKLFNPLIELESFDLYSTLQTTDLQLCLTLDGGPITIPMSIPFIFIQPKSRYILKYLLVDYFPQRLSSDDDVCFVWLMLIKEIWEFNLSIIKTYIDVCNFLYVESRAMIRIVLNQLETLVPVIFIQKE